MFYTTSYTNQSRYYDPSLDVQAKNKDQQIILKQADISTTLREIGKAGFICGTVTTIAGTIFGFAPTATLPLTIVSALTWLFFHERALQLEPQAQSILEHLKKEHKEKIKRNSSVHLNALELHLENTIKNNNISNHLIFLFNNIFFNHIIKFSTDNKNKVEVFLDKLVKNIIHSQKSVLFLPEKIVFEIQENGSINFDKNFAPYEIKLGDSDELQWQNMKIEGDNLELTTFDGTVRTVPASRFIKSIRPERKIHFCANFE